MGGRGRGSGPAGDPGRGLRAGGRGRCEGARRRRRRLRCSRGESGRSGAEREPEPEPLTRSLAPRSLTAGRSGFLLSAAEAARSGAAHRACPDSRRRARARECGARARASRARAGPSGTRGTREPPCFPSSPEAGGGGSGPGRAGPNLGAEADTGRGGPARCRLFLFLPFLRTPLLPSPLPLLSPCARLSRLLPPTPTPARCGSRFPSSLLFFSSAGLEGREEPGVPGSGAHSSCPVPI